MRKLKVYFFPAFFLACFIQVAAVVSQILSYERVLNSKNEILLQALPLDPYDIFRGRYVALKFSPNTVEHNLTIKTDSRFVSKSAYVTFHANISSGKMYIKDIFLEKPKYTALYLKVKANFYEDVAYIEYPFSRFYMQENLAIEADQWIWRSPRDAENVYAKIKLLNGKGVIDDLYIGDQRFATFLKERVKEKKELQNQQ